jgi:hypothetical protein
MKPVPQGPVFCFGTPKYSTHPPALAPARWVPGRGMPPADGDVTSERVDELTLALA